MTETNKVLKYKCVCVYIYIWKENDNKAGP